MAESACNTPLLGVNREQKQIIVVHDNSLEYFIPGLSIFDRGRREHGVLSELDVPGCCQIEQWVS